MKFNFSFETGNQKKIIDQPIQASVKSEPENITAVTSESTYSEEKHVEVIRRVFQEENERYAALPATSELEKPVIAPGRVSLYEGFRNFVPNSNAPVPTSFNFKLLGLIKNLAIWNPHFSMAVENITTLGNTDYDIDFGKSVNENAAGQYRKYLWERVATWYEFADGEDSLDNDLLAQLCVYGAISSEAVIRPDMRGIQNIVRVDPEFVRFAYDKDKSVHVPLQEIGGLSINSSNQRYPGYLELNPYTYSYIAMMRMGEMPYAIPPFLSAVESIFIENDMIKNFQNMMKRLGMMGFLSVLVNAPAVKQGESNDAYHARLTNYLEKLRPGVEKGFSRGIVMGFKDTHDFEVHAPMNPAAAEQAMNMIQALVFTGLKQDPNMHGKNNSVTETFGRVLLEKMTLQVANKQRTLATFKSRIFKLELLLNGIRVPELYVRYKPAATADEKRKEEIGTLKRNNLRSDYQDGLITQEQRAQMLGYDEPAEKEPIESEAMKIAKQTAAIKSKSKASNSIDRIKKKLKSDLPAFDYFVPEASNQLNLVEVGDFPEKEMLRFAKKYVGAVNKQYSKALRNSRDSIASEFNLLPENANLDTVTAALLFGLISSWENNFVTPVESIVENNIVDVYSFYREDQSIFSSVEELSKPTKHEFFVIPDAVFELLDYRAIEFLETIDKIYLGKFITDPDTESRIVKWIKEKFSSGDVPLGKNSSLITEFIKEFTGFVELESWKIRRIVETTLNRTRNIASTFYLQQALIVEYEVVEVMDDLTCSWCRHMNHKKFSVRETVDKYEKIFKRGIESIPELSPFATSIKIDEFIKLDPKQIQAKGIDIPSYHPYCRGKIIAHFKS